MMKKEKITVVSSCNDAFAEHVSALFVSVLENAEQPTENFDFYVIDDEITIANKRLMRETIKGYDASLHFMTIDKSRKPRIIASRFQNYSETKVLKEFSILIVT